jgi:Curli production assembly/transport component CsgG
MKRKLNFLLVPLLMTSLASQCEEQKPITIAVLDLVGPHRTLAKSISALLTANLSANEHFSLVDRTELDKVLGEQALGRSGNINADTAAKIGQLTGAKVLVTGREMMPNGQESVVVIANVIGTETGRVFSHTEQGARTDIVKLVAALSEKVSEIILKRSTNLVAGAGDTRQKLLDKIIEQTKGKKLPAVSIEIGEKAGINAASRTAETELGLIFQKSGFTVLASKSEKRPDILITGDAFIGNFEKRGDLVSCPATLSIKAQDRATGKILSLDLQQSNAVGVGDQTTAQQALQNAADQLAERLVPLLAQPEKNSQTH